MNRLWLLLADNPTDAEDYTYYLVAKVNQHIKSHFHEQIHLSTIAEHFHVNKSYLSSLYKKHSGINLTDAINKTRIDVARELLRHPETKVYEVSNTVGFTNEH